MPSATRPPPWPSPAFPEGTQTGTQPSGTHAVRLFFALWPSPTHREALATATAAVVAQVDGQAVPKANFHVTLAFLGSVPEGAVRRLIEIGGEGGYPVLDLDFDRVEYWPRPKVLVTMPGQVPAAGAEMVDRLWERIVPLGIEREHRPWRPHLTLVRRVRRLPLDGPALAVVRLPTAGSSARWSLALVESLTQTDGVHYRPLA